MDCLFVGELCENDKIDRDAVWYVHLGESAEVWGYAHWRHLASMIEPSMCGGDCRITLTTCYYTVTVLTSLDHAIRQTDRQTDRHIHLFNQGSQTSQTDTQTNRITVAIPHFAVKCIVR